MVMEWIPIVSIITSSIMVVLIVALVTKSRERRLDAQIQMQTRLIDRFGSAAELTTFLHSPAGRQFVTGVAAVPKTFARERIVAAFTRAILLAAVGVPFIVIGIMEGDSGWYIPAVIVFSLGLGYLLAAIVTWRFSQKFVAEDEQQRPAAANNE